MTGYGDPNHKHRSAEAGFDLHLTKPVDLEVFRGLLSLLRESRQIREELRRLGEERRVLSMQSDAALTSLFLLQLEMAHLYLDAGEASTEEHRRRLLGFAGRAYDRLRSWLSVHRANGRLSEVVAGLDALQERIAHMRR